MTTLEQLNLSQPLTDVYTAMETDLMMAIARQLAAGGEINATSEWRLKKLAEAGALSKETVRIIASYTGIQSDLITETIEGAAMGIVDRLEPALQACARDGYITAVSGTPISTSVRNVVTNFREQARTDLNLVNTVMQYKANSAYKTLVNQIYDDTKREELLGVLGKHTLEVASGGTSRQEAVRNCIKEFSQKGIPAFVDKRGREWSSEAYINMDIRTTVHNTAHAAQDACCEKYGIDLIQISSHMGARPKCALDQGKLFSTSNRSGVAHDGDGNPITFYPWSSSSYGQPDGILGINCHHHKYPFVDGVNFQRYFPYEKDENEARYKEFQKQRAMERRVRETSRQAEMLEAVGDTEGAKEARRKLRDQRKAYREYSNEHGLTVHNDRLTVVKVRNGDPSYKNIYSSGLTESGKSGIMKDSGDIFKPVTPQAYEKISNLGVFGDNRDDELQKAMKYVLDNIKDEEPGTECLALYSYDKLDRISKPNIGKFGAVEVIETDKDYVSIHNHASGKTFSISDVNKLREYKNCRGIFVIGNNGNMYGMIKTENYNSTSFYEYCMRKKLGFLDVTDEEFMKGCEQYGVKYYRRAD